MKPSFHINWEHGDNRAWFLRDGSRVLITGVAESPDCAYYLGVAVNLLGNPAGVELLWREDGVHAVRSRKEHGATHSFQYFLADTSRDVVGCGQMAKLGLRARMVYLTAGGKAIVRANYAWSSSGVYGFSCTVFWVNAGVSENIGYGEDGVPLVGHGNRELCDRERFELTLNVPDFSDTLSRIKKDRSFGEGSGAATGSGQGELFERPASRFKLEVGKKYQTRAGKKIKLSVGQTGAFFAYVTGDGFSCVKYDLRGTCTAVGTSLSTLTDPPVPDYNIVSSWENRNWPKTQYAGPFNRATIPPPPARKLLPSAVLLNEVSDEETGRPTPLCR